MLRPFQESPLSPPKPHPKDSQAPNPPSKDSEAARIICQHFTSKQRRRGDQSFPELQFGGTTPVFDAGQSLCMAYMQQQCRSRNLNLQSRSSLGSEMVVVRLTPPLSFLLKVMPGGRLFRRMPNPSNSFSISFLWLMGFRQSSTMRMTLQVRAVLITCSHTALDACSL